MYLLLLQSVYSFDALQTEVPGSKITNEGKKSKETVRTKMSKDTARTKRSKATDSSKKSQGTGRSKRSKDSAQKPKIPSKPQPVTLFLGVNMKKPACGAVSGLSRCWSHFIYVFQSRDVPLDPKDVRSIS